MIRPLERSLRLAPGLHCRSEQLRLREELVDDARVQSIPDPLELSTREYKTRGLPRERVLGDREHEVIEERLHARVGACCEEQLFWRSEMRLDVADRGRDGRCEEAPHRLRVFAGLVLRGCDDREIDLAALRQFQRRISADDAALTLEIHDVRDLVERPGCEAVLLELCGGGDRGILRTARVDRRGAGLRALRPGSRRTNKRGLGRLLEPLLQFRQFLTGAEFTARVIEYAEANPKVGGDFRPVELARVKADAARTLEHVPECVIKRAGKIRAAVGVHFAERDRAASASQVHGCLKHLSRPVRRRHEVPADRLRERLQERRHKFRAKPRHLPVKTDGVESGKERQRYLHGHAVIVRARVEAVAQL